LQAFLPKLLKIIFIGVYKHINNITSNVKISVICPSYNRDSFLEECIAPVIAVADAEFILVDDGSSDGTRELVRNLQDRYGADRIVVISLGGNQGAQVARNRGMALARGEMILFCDSDDVLEASGVKDLAETLAQETDLDYAYGKVVMTDVDLKPLTGLATIGSPFEDSPYEMAGYHWHTMGALYRRGYLEQVGPWNPVLTGSQDWEYQARVKLAGGRGLFVDSLVGYWRQHEGGRVGARKFRPDYVRSVVTACDVILSGARSNGKCDKALQRRLAKKLIIHALESGAHGDLDIRRDCLSHAASAVLGDLGFSLVIKGIQLTPSWFDGMIWNRLIAK
jgi:glycosyltransferase involved in cell wall biosynthesis